MKHMRYIYVCYSVIKLVTLSLILTMAANANPNFVISLGMHMDRNGKLIQPDKLMMSEAIKAYRKGYNQSAFSYFKKAAALGNTLSQRYIGLMYINAMGVKKDLAKGYAWLKLASKDGTERNVELESQVYKLLTKEQIEQANIEYNLVKEDYGSIAALTRRDRWVHKQKMKMLGTRTGSLAFAPIAFDSPHGNGFYNQMQAYVDDYNFGYISSGEIIPVEESELQKETESEQVE